MENLGYEVEKVSKFLTKKQEDFDMVMQTSREIVRDAGLSITFIHNNKAEKAAEKLAAMGDKIKRLQKMDARFRYNTSQAYQEFAEAFIFSSIKKKKVIPSMKETGVGEEGYLMGLMDVVGELKREILESLSAEKIKDAEFYFDMMKIIYDSTRSIRFAEAVLSGFRKKQDVARIQIENAGSEILTFRNRRK